MKLLSLFAAFWMCLGWLFCPACTQAQGFVFDAELYKSIPLAAPLLRGDMTNLPTNFTLQAYAPRPRNQGAYGTCVGWSVAYAARTMLLAIDNQWKDKDVITQNALSPFFLYERSKGKNDYQCQEGISLYKGLEEIKNTGSVPLNDFAEACGKTVTKQQEIDAAKFKIKDYKRLFETQATNKVELIKKAIAEKKPVVVGIQCCFESFKNAKSIDYWMPKLNDLFIDEGHALVVVGYDDELEGGSFQLMNSWGSSWGNQGFLWVSYKDFVPMIYEGYEMSVENNASLTSLSGQVNFMLSAGYEMTANFNEKGYYEMADKYYSGTLFRLFISNQEPSYVYAFGLDQQFKTYRIFPFSPEVSPYLGYQRNNVAIPDESHFVKLDQNPGDEFFLVLYSKEKLDLASIMQKMEITQGDVMARLRFALGDKLMDSKEIAYNRTGKMGFKGISTTKTIVPLIILLKHL